MKLGLGLGMAATHHHAGQANPLLTLPALLTYMDFTDTDSYTYSTSPLVASATPQAGVTGFAQATGTKQPSYDAAAFNGAGGLAMQEADEFLLSDTDSGAPVATTIGMVLSLPTYVSGNKDIFSIGTAGSGSASARLTHPATGRISYGRNEASQFEVIGDTGGDGTHIVILRFNSASSVDAYVDTLTPVSFDPLSNYQSQRIYLGDRNSATGDPGLAFAEFFQTGAALADSDIAAVMDFWADRYGVTLS